MEISLFDSTHCIALNEDGKNLFTILNTAIKVKVYPKTQIEKTFLQNPNLLEKKKLQQNKERKRSHFWSGKEYIYVELRQKKTLPRTQKKEKPLQIFG